MLARQVEHEGVLVVEVLALFRREPDLAGHLLALLVFLQDPLDLGAHRGDDVTGARELRVHEELLQGRALLPGGEAIARRAGGGDLVDGVEDAALAAPEVRQAVDDDDLEALGHGGVVSLHETLHAVGRPEGQDGVGTEVAVEVAGAVLGVDQGDLAEVPAGQALGDQQSRVGLARA